MADLNARRAQAQAEHARQLQARLDAERKAGEAERERQCSTRSPRADRRRGWSGRRACSPTTAVSSGRWAPQAEVHVVSGTALDGGAAVHVASEAAKGAVAAAMKPLMPA